MKNIPVHFISQGLPVNAKPNNGTNSILNQKLLFLLYEQKGEDIADD
jgi:hypothetical protein